MSERPIPVILCIDVEPDPRRVPHDRPDPWYGYEHLQTWIRGLRTRIEVVTGSPAQFAWYYRLDPQIREVYGRPEWALDHYRAHVEEIEEAGDELGSHSHANRWTGDDWLIDHGDQGWVDHCLRVCFEAFERALGRRCEMFRHGDRFLNDATVATLEQLGALYDTTPEPGFPHRASMDLSEPATGELPDCRGLPKQPYHPSREDWRRADTGGGYRIRLIPVSTGFVPRSWHRESWYAPVSRSIRRLFGHGVERWRPRVAANLARPTRWVCYALDHLLAELPKPHLVLELRCTSPSHPELGANVETTLNHLLTHPRARDFVFTAPRRALEIFDRMDSSATA